MNVSFFHIYHTNDIHSHFEQWGKIVSFLKRRKTKHLIQGEDVLLVDVGDFVDRSHPISEATSGKGNITLLNEAGYDYVTIGNNEGITLSKRELEHLYDDATFQVLVNNLYHEQGERPSFAKPYVIHEIEHGIKIGLVGVTVAYPDFYSPLGWDIQNPFEAVAQSLKELEDQVDMIVVLSHLGKNDDKKLANLFPQIDVIIGAHTHHLFEHGFRENGVLLCCAEKYGHYVGHVSLAIDIDRKKVVDKTAMTTVASSLQEKSLETQQSLEMLQKRSQGLLSEARAHLSQPLIVDWFHPSPFSKLLATTLRQWCKADVGMVNAGILLSSLPEGIVTKGDIHRICPHPIHPCRVFLHGWEFEEVIKRAAADEMEQLEIKGFGFRGKVMGKMVYDGITVTENNILVNDAPLQPEKNYAVGTIDMFTFGTLFPEIRYAKEKKLYIPEFIRNVLEWELAHELRRN